MKGNLSSLLLFLAPLLPVNPARAADQLIPAGSLMQCTIAEPKLSSKTAEVGDPVLCQLSHTERYGRAVLPYGSYLVGRFEEYKDPGPFVGKGWLELRFDRMVVQPGTIITISAKIVDVPGFSVDRTGKIHGKGHAVRDTVEWSIPILWPLDVLNLPRRGPRPTLKGETHLTLKIMDDLGVPQSPLQQRDASGLYRREPVFYAPPVRTFAPPPQPIVLIAPPVQVLRNGVYFRTIGR